MLNLAQVGSVVCVVALVLGFSSGVADAGLSTNCVAADGTATSLLVHIKDKKSKKKKHDQDSGLTECTIQGAGSGGGCKNGKWVCEKMKSGQKCCGCVVAKGTETTAPGTDAPQSEKGGNDPSSMGWKYLNLEKSD
jgi:hypothetical protein